MLDTVCTSTNSAVSTSALKRLPQGKLCAGGLWQMRGTKRPFKSLLSMIVRACGPAIPCKVLLPGIQALAEKLETASNSVKGQMHIYEMGRLVKYSSRNSSMIHACAGKTLAENLESVPDLTKGQMLIYPIDRPIKSSGHIQIMYGNLAPEGCVGKITGKEGLEFQGPARVFDDEEAMLKAVEAGPQTFKVGRKLVKVVSGPADIQHEEDDQPKFDTVLIACMLVLGCQSHFG